MGQKIMCTEEGRMNYDVIQNKFRLLQKFVQDFIMKKQFNSASSQPQKDQQNITDSQFKQDLKNYKQMSLLYKNLSQNLCKHLTKFRFILIESARFYRKGDFQAKKQGSYTWNLDRRHLFTGSSDIFGKYRDDFSKMQKTIEGLNGKQQGRLFASKDILGNPCVGHPKMFYIKYYCGIIQDNLIFKISKPKQLHVQENKQVILDCLQTHNP